YVNRLSLRSRHLPHARRSGPVSLSSESPRNRLQEAVQDISSGARRAESRCELRPQTLQLLKAWTGRTLDLPQHIPLCRQPPFLPKKPPTPTDQSPLFCLLLNVTLPGWSWPRLFSKDTDAFFRRGCFFFSFSHHFHQLPRGPPLARMAKA